MRTHQGGVGIDDQRVVGIAVGVRRVLAGQRPHPRPGRGTRRLEESCALGMEATTLARSVRSMRGTSYLHDLGKHLSPYQDVNVVSSLFEGMIEIGISPGD
ncbi:hypothetical protein GCM10009744_59260 [Kribbella alba]|uniref:HD-GYP domain-containing protein n=1 Tax=Kribbella alba TaxID=190197 RepID=A0ABN2FSH6_9ACTN